MRIHWPDPKGESTTTPVSRVSERWRSREDSVLIVINIIVIVNRGEPRFYITDEGDHVIILVRGLLFRLPSLWWVSLFDRSTSYYHLKKKLCLFVLSSKPKL